MGARDIKYCYLFAFNTTICTVLEDISGDDLTITFVTIGYNNLGTRVQMGKAEGCKQMGKSNFDAFEHSQFVAAAISHHVQDKIINDIAFKSISKC